MLSDAIQCFDGQVAALKAVVRAFEPHQANFLQDYCRSNVASEREAATWIVKALLETRGDHGLDLSRFFQGLEGETEWPVLLHIVQSVQFATKEAAPHAPSIRALCDHTKTLVAVWALDAWVRVVVETGADRHDATRAVQSAMQDKRASMRARARHLGKILEL